MPIDAQRIMRNVEERRLVDFLRELVRIPSPSGEEGRMAEAVAGQMESVGLSAEIIGGNVVGKTAMRGEPKLIVNGHMDTVPVGDASSWTMDPFGGELRDGRVYGRGSCDMKGGIAAMVMAYDAVRRSGLSLDGLVLTAVVEEETGGKLGERKGTIELIDKGVIRKAPALIGEPTNLRIGIGHRSKADILIEVRGKSAHASTPERGINAIVKAAEVILALQKRLKLKEHRILGRGTINIGLISGGTKSNVVPDMCRVVVDRRLTMGETPESVVADIKGVVDELAEKGEQLSIDVKYVYGWYPTLMSEDEPIVKQVLNAASTVLKSKPKVYAPPYHTDGGFIHHMAKVPIAILGPGNEATAHTADEYVEVSQVIDAARIYALTMAEICSG